ncbi:hypothetical protein MSAN_02448800 [Mycena sanguinolenta]|uniref:Uncharacterized protein n=1 Tax=Mycena sanguinolenta TaxID=230812 RepID=A0A8H6WXX4_9AGAR|nr:hypothetical protein MSAN_02448800 [Mycena sanguinolenta]
MAAARDYGDTSPSAARWHGRCHTMLMHKAPRPRSGVYAPQRRGLSPRSPFGSTMLPALGLPFLYPLLALSGHHHARLSSSQLSASLFRYSGLDSQVPAMLPSHGSSSRWTG